MLPPIFDSYEHSGSNKLGKYPLNKLSKLEVFFLISEISQSLFLQSLSISNLPLKASDNSAYEESMNILELIDWGLNSITVGRDLYIKYCPKILN